MIRPRAQAHILSRIVSGPRCSLHSLHRTYGLGRLLGRGPLRQKTWIGSPAGAITVPCSDAGTLTTTPHSKVGCLDTAAHNIRQLGTVMFHLGRLSTPPSTLPLSAPEQMIRVCYARSWGSIELSMSKSGNSEQAAREGSALYPPWRAHKAVRLRGQRQQQHLKKPRRAGSRGEISPVETPAGPMV